MKRTVLSCVLATVIAAPLSAQQAQAPAVGTPNRDVVLEVPHLSVDSIRLAVDSLRAKVALDARVANLVRVSAGADVRIDSVVLEIDGVLAEAYLYVDLDNVARIVNRVFATLGRNPELLNGLLEYTSVHFAREEDLMDRQGYPDLDAHKAAQRYFVDEVRKLSRE